MTTTFVMPQSFVVELVKLAHQKDAREISDDAPAVIAKALEVVKSEPYADFEFYLPLLKANNCDASVLFDTEVTDETQEAFVAYLCYVLMG